MICRESATGRIKSARHVLVPHPHLTRSRALAGPLSRARDRWWVARRSERNEVPRTAPALWLPLRCPSFSALARRIVPVEKEIETVASGFASAWPCFHLFAASPRIVGFQGSRGPPPSFLGWTNFLRSRRINRGWRGPRRWSISRYVRNRT